MKNEIVSYDFTPDIPTEEIFLGREENGCIYCKRPYEKSFFIKKAHAVPELLGNKFLFSKNECDLCNAIFSKIERDFSFFIGIDRTLYSMKGKKGVPRHAFNEDQKIIHNKHFNIPVVSVLPSTGNVKLDHSNKTSTIEYTKNSYYNTSVFKCLVKMALSILPIELVWKYTVLTEFVRQDITRPYPLKKLTEEQYKQSNGELEYFNFNFFMLITRLRFFNMPPRRGFKISLVKTEVESNCFIFMLYFGSVALQIIIPDDDFLLRAFCEQVVHGSTHKFMLLSPDAIASILPTSKFSSDVIDCREHKKIEKEVEVKGFSYGNAIKLDEEILKLDDNGNLTEDSLRRAITILKWNMLLTVIWKNNSAVQYSFNCTVGGSETGGHNAIRSVGLISEA